jgi:AcrR family transcriptional regulator
MKPGRPTAPTLTKAAILHSALTMIDAGKPLTFRSLATAHGVTPMAIAHHTGSRDDLLSDLITQCFAFAPPTNDTPRARLRDLLTRYVQTVLHHPNLLTLTFATPALITGPLRDLTNHLRADLPSDIVLHLTIDYTHGFALSAAAAPPGAGPTLPDYLAGLDWLLDHSFPPG